MDWQKYFPRLDTLRIVVTGMNGVAYVSPAVIERMHQVAQVDFRPRRLGVEMEDLNWGAVYLWEWIARRWWRIGQGA
jgi:hypothetical protein